MHSDRCVGRCNRAEINGIALVAGKNRMSHAIHGEGEGDGDNGVSNKALPVVDKVVHCLSDLRAHGRGGIERSGNILRVGKCLRVCFPSLRVILGSIGGVDGAHCYSRVEMRLNSVKLYESGTPKRYLLLCISNIDGGYSGCFPCSHLGLPSCVILLPLCILLIISSKLALVGALAGMLGSNRLLGSLGRVVEIHRAVSGFLPAVPGDRIKIIVTEEVISLIPVDGAFRIGCALDCLNGGLERINGSRSHLCIKSFGSCGQSRGDRLIGCEIRCIAEVSFQLGSERIVGGCYKSCLILCPLCVRICAVVSALTLLAGILAVLGRNLIVIVDKDRGRAANRTGFTADRSRSCSFNGIINRICSVGKRCSVCSCFCLPKDFGYISVFVFRFTREAYIFKECSAIVLKRGCILSISRFRQMSGILNSVDSYTDAVDFIKSLILVDKSGARLNKSQFSGNRLNVLGLRIVLSIGTVISIVRSVKRSSACERFAVLGEDKVADREDDGGIRCTGLGHGDVLGESAVDYIAGLNTGDSDIGSVARHIIGSRRNAVDSILIESVLSEVAVLVSVASVYTLGSVVDRNGVSIFYSGRTGKLHLAELGFIRQTHYLGHDIDDRRNEFALVAVKRADKVLNDVGKLIVLHYGIERVIVLRRNRSGDNRVEDVCDKSYDALLDSLLGEGAVLISLEEVGKAGQILVKDQSFKDRINDIL